MLLPPLPRKLTLHPTPLSLRNARPHGTADVQVLDGDMTFADLWPLFDQAQAGRTLPEPEARRLVRQLLRQNAAPPWRPHADNAGAVVAIHRALCELRLAGITAQALQNMEKPVPLTALLAAYEEALQNRQWSDEADRQRDAVLQVAQGHLPASLREIERIEVLPGTELLGARLDILNMFAARGIAVRVQVPWDEDRPQAFTWPEALIHSLETRAHQAISIVFTPRHGRGALQPVVSALHRDPAIAPLTAAGEAAATPPIIVRRAPAGLRHAEGVAAQVAAWLTAGIPAQSIAVVAPQSAMATQAVRALQGAGIPCTHKVQRNLAQSRIGHVYLTGLRAQKGKAGGAWWVSLWEAHGRSVTTPGGIWPPTRVTRALRRAGLATARPWGLTPDPSSPGPARALPEACAAPILEAMAELCAPLAALPAKGALNDMAPALQAWAQVLTRPRHFDAGFNPATDPAGESETGRDPALEAAVNGEAEAAALLQQCILEAVQGEAGAHDTWTRAQMADWLETLFCERTYLAVPSDSQGVRVLRPEDAVGGRFRCLIFAGAEMESFPRALPANPFLPEAMRTAINRLLGPRLLQYAPMLGRGALPAIARDQWLWLEAAATVSEQWVVTLQESSDGLLSPSEMVDELLRVSGVQITALTDDGCVDATVPARWVPRLWAAEPARSGALIQKIDPALPARLERRWTSATARPVHAGVPPAVATAVRRYMENTVHSASRLDALGMCAFRFVAAALWGLSPDDDPSLGATPQELGSAAHAALHHVYASRMQDGGLHQGRAAPQAALAAAREVMAARAADILAETRVHPLLQPALLAETAATALGQLACDLKAAGPQEPVALEYSFDDRHPEGPDALSITHPDGTTQVRVRGSIDRVDVTDTHVRVLDYKRTVRPRQPDRHFQLALYAAIALRDLRPAAQQVQVGWAGLRPAKIHWAQDIPDTPDALITHLRERLFARIDPVAQGMFHPDPDTPDTCDYCDFRRLCRRDDRPAATAAPQLPEPTYV